MRILLAGNLLPKSVRDGLGAAYPVDVVHDAEHALAALATTPYDLIVSEGLPLLKLLRNANEQRPVLLLTEESDAPHRAECLDAGADYVIARPCSPEELLAGCRALVRRSYGRGSPVLVSGAVHFSIATGSVEKNGRQIALSSRERAVLEKLMGCAGQIVSRERIEAHIYDWHSGARVESNTVEVYISALRRKLGRDFIKTVRGSGYVIPV